MSRRVVIKIGTSVLSGGGRALDRGHMGNLARQCAELHRAGHDVIVCSSGAILAGRERLGLENLPATIAERQMLAAVGQSRLMRTWEELFDGFDIRVGQILLTRADVTDRGRYLNAREALGALLERRIVPIVNENDAVATTEIKVGDNDNLSALIALLAEADLLVLLTDQPGLFTADPRKHPEAQLIPEVEAIDDTLKRLAGSGGSGLGIGGMATKLQAADAARRGGAAVVIASGHAPDVITRVVSGDVVGTRFLATGSMVDARKQWIYAGKAPAGSLTIDEGALDALKSRGRSLLCAGITVVEGTFQRGDTVMVRGLDGKDVARGLVRYDAQELGLIAGRRSDAIASILGYNGGPVAIHRNDLVLS